jgi:hypothetical protein
MSIYESKLRYFQGELIIGHETIRISDFQNGKIAACGQRELRAVLKTLADLFIVPIKIMNGKGKCNISSTYRP